ncbi:glycoside hydrolase family 73 protein [Limosilactobacillus sp.]|jgi:flagellum-specific peptidoglycan hydrolase FlgJ|uniref:glycoside hydrolase family 73 protein n=1 Tax=Limosilactobacillus sp. TaxID=2773925 RepID=UPI0025C2DECA|nr:glycoside hydrolase family 73 protein [Limosilactobacillus sp.]MCH3923137.1 glycoside hydrolase family 73 protein [Limosilactobacillus sp.]MCH3927820.1 glycoside hydrolase family 73 protein [Limosilactobacillus sp.]
MKKIILLSTVALLALNNPGTALASVQADPNQEAIQRIIDQQPVDEQAVQEQGEDYAAAFLKAFSAQSLIYRQAFQEGVRDGQQGHWERPSGQVAAIAYQRGWQQGQRARQAEEETSQAAAKEDTGTTPANSQTAPEQEAAADQADEAEVAEQTPTPDQRAFIRHLAGLAQDIGQEYDLYPSVIIAQAALESNWGSSKLARAPFHNLFGVKGYFAGAATSQPTTEYLGGQRLTVRDNFRRYQSDVQALRDYAQTLAAPLYRNVHRQNATTYRQATHALQGRYATDPQYEQKLNHLIAAYRLTKYDSPSPKPHHDRPTLHQPTLQTSAPSDETATADSLHRPTQHHHQRYAFSPLASIIGGAGSAGLIEIVRRLILK